jgi:hypothetical protein
MHRLSLLALVLAPLFLPACAAMEEMEREHREQTCQREVGYERGMNDGREGKRMDSQFASVCDPESRREVMTGYRQGYETARRELADEREGVVVQTPGFQLRMKGKLDRRWACETAAFGHSYNGVGNSRAEAAAEARRQCERHNHAMHCEREECREIR